MIFFIRYDFTCTKTVDGNVVTVISYLDLHTTENLQYILAWWVSRFPLLAWWHHSIQVISLPFLLPSSTPLILSSSPGSLAMKQHLCRNCLRSSNCVIYFLRNYGGLTVWLHTIGGSSSVLGYSFTRVLGYSVTITKSSCDTWLKRHANWCVLMWHVTVVISPTNCAAINAKTMEATCTPVFFSHRLVTVSYYPLSITQDTDMVCWVQKIMLSTSVCTRYNDDLLAAGLN